MEDNWLYFLDNEEWYIYDYDKREYFLTDKATPEARESYNAYIELKRKRQQGGKYFT